MHSIKSYMRLLGTDSEAAEMMHAFIAPLALFTIHNYGGRWLSSPGW